MIEPTTVSNPLLDSNRFGMSSTTATTTNFQPPQQQQLLSHSNNMMMMNNTSSNNQQVVSVSNNFNHQELNNQNVGILDILSGGNQMKSNNNNGFSSLNNENQTVISSNSIRNLNPSARKSLPSTSTLSPYQIHSSNDSNSFSPRFARQFSQPPLSFVNEQDSSIIGNNEELSGGEEEETQQVSSKTNESQTNGQPNSRRMNYACTECRKAHKACTGERPCDRCKKLGMEDKCKSTIRKKRILTKRYWVHFMSNDGSNNTNSMMDDSSAGDQSPASIHPPQQSFFPNNPNNNFLGGPPMKNSSSMNFKRHSSANLPSFSSIKRLNQGLSGGSSNSAAMSSFQGSEMMSSSGGDVQMLNPNEYTMYSGDRSPRQVPHSYNYHPYKSPRGGQQQQHSEMMDQSSPNQILSNNNINNNGMNSNSGGSGFASPRNSFNRAASSSQIPTQLQQQQQNGNYPFHGTASLDAYRLDGKMPTGNPNANSVESSPRESGAILNHLNTSTFNNSVGSQLDPQTVNRHYNRGSMRIQPLFNQHTKSLSDTNLLPSPSMLLDHQRQQSMFNFPIHHQQATNSTTNGNNMAMDEFSNSNSQTNQHQQHHNLHIPPIMLEKNPNIPQFTIQPSPNQSNSNSNTPRSGIFYESSPRSGNNNMGGGEYYYSPRSEVDYSSDMSSLTNSPRFGAGGGADSNSSTPRSLIGSMNGMSINDTSPLSQQLSQQQQQQYPPGYRGSLHYDSPSLMVPGNRKSVAGYLNQAGNRFSLGSAYHGSAYASTQQQNGQLSNSTSTATTTAYTNNPGNRYSLGPNQSLNQDLYQYSTRSGNFRK